MLNHNQERRLRPYQHQHLFEGLEAGDLSRLVHDELHIDEYKSKLGEDKDVAVISFKVRGKNPANDVVNFLEKGYDWVIDADVSSGEMADGDYIVFIEIERTPELGSRIMRMLDDMQNVVDVTIDDWRVRYYQDHKEYRLDQDILDRVIPNTPEEYDRRYGQREIDKLKAVSGIKVDTKAPKNEYTESLRIAAGIL